MIIISVSFNAFSLNKSIVIYNNHEEAKTLIKIFLNSQNLDDFFKNRASCYKQFNVTSDIELSNLLLERLMDVLYENNIKACVCDQLHVDLIDRSNGDF